jgi:L-rhamnose isomerase
MDLEKKCIEKFEYLNSLYNEYIEDGKKFYGQSNLQQLEAVYQNGVKLLFCNIESGVEIIDLIKLFSKANYRDIKLEKCSDAYLYNFWTKAIYHNAMSDYVPGVVYIGHYNKIS